MAWGAAYDARGRHGNTPVVCVRASSMGATVSRSSTARARCRTSVSSAGDRSVGGMSAYFCAGPRCINMQADQPVVVAIGACATVTDEAKASRAPRKISLPICTRNDRELIRAAAAPIWEFRVRERDEDR